MASDETDEKEHEKYHKQYLGNLGCRARQTSETENCG